MTSSQDNQPERKRRKRKSQLKSEFPGFYNDNDSDDDGLIRDPDYVNALLEVQAGGPDVKEEEEDRPITAKKGKKRGRKKKEELVEEGDDDEDEMLDVPKKRGPRKKRAPDGSSVVNGKEDADLFDFPQDEALRDHSMRHQ